MPFIGARSQGATAAAVMAASMALPPSQRLESQPRRREPSEVIMPWRAWAPSVCPDVAEAGRPG